MLNTDIERRELRAAASRRARYSAGLAQNEGEVVEAQRLRYRVFADEMGARLPRTFSRTDSDIYDHYCEHVIVRDESMDKVVGTFRILSPKGACRIGSYYAETDFDLVRLKHLRDRMVEVGRFCIDAEYRSGTVVSLLWTKLAEYITTNNHQYLIGCASMGMTDGGHNAANAFVQLVDSHIAPIEYRASPRRRLPFESLVTGEPAEVPPVVKGYLRAGAWLCGEPAWDADMNTADLLLLLPIARIAPRYHDRS